MSTSTTTKKKSVSLFCVWDCTRPDHQSYTRAQLAQATARNRMMETMQDICTPQTLLIRGWQSTYALHELWRQVPEIVLNCSSVTFCVINKMYAKQRINWKSSRHLQFVLYHNPVTANILTHTTHQEHAYHVHYSRTPHSLCVVNTLRCTTSILHMMNILNTHMKKNCTTHSARSTET